MLLMRLIVHVPQHVCGGQVQPVGGDFSVSFTFTAECARLSWAESIGVLSLSLPPTSLQECCILGRDIAVSGDQI